jgi:hypothetical protein
MKAPAHTPPTQAALSRLAFARSLHGLIVNGDAIVGSTPKSRAARGRLAVEIRQLEAEIRTAKN